MNAVQMVTTPPRGSGQVGMDRALFLRMAVVCSRRRRGSVERHDTAQRNTQLCPCVPSIAGQVLTHLAQSVCLALALLCCPLLVPRMNPCTL
jgi:hypothetical protein